MEMGLVMSATEPEHDQKGATKYCLQLALCAQEKVVIGVVDMEQTHANTYQDP